MKWLKVFRPDENPISNVVSSFPKNCMNAMEDSLVKDLVFSDTAHEIINDFESIRERVSEESQLLLRVEGPFKFWC